MLAVRDSTLLVKCDAVGTIQRDDGVPIVQLVAGVARIGARETALRQEHGNFAVRRIPLVDRVGWNVAEDQIARRSGVHPHRSFQKAKAIRHFFNLSAGGDQRVQCRIEANDLPAVLSGKRDASEKRREREKKDSYFLSHERATLPIEFHCVTIPAFPARLSVADRSSPSGRLQTHITKANTKQLGAPSFMTVKE